MSLGVNFETINNTYKESKNSISNWAKSILFHAKVHGISDAYSEDGTAKSFPLGAILDQERNFLKHDNFTKYQVLATIYHAHKHFAKGVVGVDERFSKAIDLMFEDDNVYRAFLNGGTIKVNNENFSLSTLSLPQNYADESRVFFNTVKDSASSFAINESRSFGFDSYFLFKNNHNLKLSESFESLNGVDFKKHKDALRDMIQDCDDYVLLDVKKKNEDESGGSDFTEHIGERVDYLKNLGVLEDEDVDFFKNNKKKRIKLKKEKIIEIFEKIVKKESNNDFESVDKGLKAFFSLLNLGKNRIGLKPARIMGVEGGLFFADLAKNVYQKGNQSGIFDKIDREKEHGNLVDNGILKIRSDYRKNSNEASGLSFAKNALSSISSNFIGLKNLKHKLASSIGSSASTVVIAALTIVFTALIASAAFAFSPYTLAIAGAGAIACFAVYGIIGGIVSWVGGRKSEKIAKEVCEKFKTINLSNDCSDKNNQIEDVDSNKTPLIVKNEEPIFFKSFNNEIDEIIKPIQISKQEYDQDDDASILGILDILEKGSKRTAGKIKEIKNTKNKNENDINNNHNNLQNNKESYPNYRQDLSNVFKRENAEKTVYNGIYKNPQRNAQSDKNANKVNTEQKRETTSMLTKTHQARGVV